MRPEDEKNVEITKKRIITDFEQSPDKLRYVLSISTARSDDSCKEY